MRRWSGLGYGGKTSGYFLTNDCNGYFRCIGSYVLTKAMSVVDGLVAPKPPSQVIGISADIYISGRNSVSGSTFIPRPSRARVRVTMAEASPAPGRVAAGVGSVSWGAATEPNSPDRSVRPTFRLRSDYISITGISSNDYSLT